VNKPTPTRLDADPEEKGGVKEKVDVRSDFEKKMI
jgi:hypothetical protein